MKIAIGGDHAGFEYKKKLIPFLEEMGHAATDFGPHSDASCDYPDFAHPVAENVANGNHDLGILICGSGNGVCLTANKHRGIRAALCWNTELAALSRQHNDANIICIPARFVDLQTTKDMVRTFIETPFEGGRHSRRVEKIDL